MKLINKYRKLRFLLFFTLLPIFIGKKIIFRRKLGSFIGHGFYFYIEDGRCIIGEAFYAKSSLNITLAGGIIEIGDNVFFNHDVSLNCHLKIRIGDNVLLGEGVKLYDHNHCFKKPTLISSQGFKNAPIVIEDNVWIGSNVIILKGVTIGKNSVISAGSIVRSSIPADSIYINNQVSEINRD